MSVKREGDSPTQNRGKVVRIYVLVSILTTVLLAGLKLAFEHSSFGHEVELSAFGKLQGSLSEIDVNNPIVMLDISDLPGGKGVPTPRDKLEAIIGALADQQPMAIAVDEEFSPLSNRYRSDDDEEFFDFCLDIRNTKKIPVFLAVGERKGAPPEAWLGQKKYEELAVAVAADINDTSRIPLWVRANGAGEELKTMSYALALEYRKHLPDAPRWIRWAVDKKLEGDHDKSENAETTTDELTLTYADRLVNYSKLDAMKLAAQKDTSAQSVKDTGSGYYKKLVILGDVSRPLDKFPIPGRKIDEGGSLLHASAVYTLIKEPLFEFKPWVRILLDFGIASIIIAMVAFIRYRNPEKLDWLGKQAVFVFIAIVVVIAGGWILVRVSGVLWLDFWLVAFALFLHPKVEHGLQKLAARRKDKGKAANQSPRASDQQAPTPEGKSTHTAACVLIAIVFSVSTATAQDITDKCTDGIAAVALDLHVKAKRKGKGKKPACYFRENKNSPWQELSAADARQKQFRAGQHLCCDNGCSLVILLCRTREQFPVVKNPPYWHSVIESFSPSNGIDDRYKEIPARVQLFRPENPDPQSNFSAGVGEGRAEYGGVQLLSTPSPSSRRADSSSTANAGTREDLATALGYHPRHTIAGRETADPKNLGGKTPEATERMDRAATEAVRETREPKSDRSDAGAASKASGENLRESSPAAEAAKSSASEKLNASVDRPARKVSEFIADTGSPANADPSVGQAVYRALIARFEKLVSEANAARDAKDYSLAQRLYLEAEQLRPDHPSAPYGLGNVYFDQGKLEEADRAYRRALKLRPWSPEISMALGVLLLQPGEDIPTAERLLQAEGVLWTAALVDPRNGTAWDLLDAVMHKRGATLEELERTYRQVLELDPYRVRARLRLSQVLRKIGRKDEADRELRKSVDIAHERSDLIAVATTMQSLKRYESAERLLRRALALNAKDAHAQYFLGSILVLRKHYRRAIDPLELAVGLSPNEFAPSYLLGMTHLRAKDLAKAERVFDKVATIASPQGDEFPAIALAFASVGDGYAKAHLTSDAIRVYEKVLRYDADDLETRDKLAKLRDRMSR